MTQIGTRLAFNLSEDDAEDEFGLTDDNHRASLIAKLAYSSSVRSLSGNRKLNSKTKYMQIAFNGQLSNAINVIRRLPRSERILIEAGTPFIKRYGTNGIRSLASAWSGYVVADMKTADGGADEVNMVREAGASGITVLGSAPEATLKRFMIACKDQGIDSIVDMLGVADPLRVLMPLFRTQPDVVELHLGRDEETVRGKVIEYRQVRRIKSKFSSLIGAAGGVDLKQAQTASFNGADIVVVNVVEPGQEWTGMNATGDVAKIAADFLKTID